MTKSFEVVTMSLPIWHRDFEFNLQRNDAYSSGDLGLLAQLENLVATSKPPQPTPAICPSPWRKEPMHLVCTCGKPMVLAQDRFGGWALYCDVTAGDYAPGSAHTPEDTEPAPGSSPAHISIRASSLDDAFELWRKLMLRADAPSAVVDEMRGPEYDPKEYQ